MRRSGTRAGRLRPTLRGAGRARRQRRSAAEGRAFSHGLFDRRVKRSVRMSSSKGMFTGLIEAVGRVGRLRSWRRTTARDQTPLAADLSGRERGGERRVSDRARREAAAFYADIGPETARVTTLGALRPISRSTSSGRCGPTAASAAILYRAMSTASGPSARCAPRATPAGWRRVARACTVLRPEGLGGRRWGQPDRGGLDGDHFDVMIIPFTWVHTPWVAAGRRDGEPGMRHGGQVRRPRGAVYDFDDRTRQDPDRQRGAQAHPSRRSTTRSRPSAPAG